MPANQAARAARKMREAEELREESAYLAAALNDRIEEDDQRRKDAGEEPLMHLVIPEDFFSRPRMYGYKVDIDYWGKYGRDYLVQSGADRAEVDEISRSEILSVTLSRLRRLTGIRYMSPEWCLPEEYDRAAARAVPLRPLRPPISAEDDSTSSAHWGYYEPEPEPLFLILMLFMVTRYKKVLKRPTQKQVDMLSAELNCQPAWYVDAEEDD